MNLKTRANRGFDCLSLCLSEVTNKLTNKATKRPQNGRRWLIVCTNRQTNRQTVKPAWIKAKTGIFLIVCLFVTDPRTPYFLPIFKQNFRVCGGVRQTDKQTRNHPHVGRFNHHHSTPKRGRLQMLRPTFF